MVTTILIWLSLLFIVVATASIPLLLLIIAQPKFSHKKRYKDPNTKVFVFALLLLIVLLVVKVFFISQMELEAIPAFLSQSHLEKSEVKKGDALFPVNKTTIKEYSNYYRWQALPSKAPFPADNTPSQERIALGRKLFNDKTLSNDGTVSCATCHNLELLAGADGKKLAQGIGGQMGSRNTPTVWNSAFQTHLFWDGRANSLEQQALKPILNPVEMGMESEQAIIDRLKQQPNYRKLFISAFGEGPITIDKITKALATYQRTLITNDSPYDDFVRGDKKALNDQQINGMALFEKTGCVLCHSGPNFSMASVFSKGLPMRLFPANPSPLTEGLGLIESETGKPSTWRIPSLRNVALTGPWLHNGSVEKLEDVVRIMASAQLGKGGDKNIFWSNNQLVVIENPALTNSEVNDIVAFLQALSSKRLMSLSDTTAQTVNNKEKNFHDSSE